MKTLKIDLYGLQLATRQTHWADAVRDLGITHTASEASTIADAVWIYGCENIPETLPEWITPSGRVKGRPEI